MKNIKLLFSKIKYIKVIDIIGCIMFFFMIPISFFYKIVLKIRKQKFWLISENGDCMTACDNGFNFFEYLKKIGLKNVFFVINKRSPYINNFDTYKESIIIQGSFKHWLYYMSADKLISTHTLSAPSMGIFYLLQKLKLAKRNTVFLQHGITKDNLPSLYYENCNIGLFICGAYKEYEYIKDKFHYPDDNIKYTGFARFDNLHNIEFKNNQIVVMPTWRRQISMDIENDDDFINTDFYLEYQNLLDNSRLIDYLEKNNIKLIFYVHQLMCRFLKYFKSNSNNIIIAYREDYSIQQLIKESSLLITDYSSVFFDFAYMKKPVIFFQFDIKEYRLNQYEEGYFSYNDDGFGPVIINVDDLVDEIIENFQSKLIIKDYYLKRTNDFFVLNDNNNCKRIYEEIRKMK